MNSNSTHSSWSLLPLVGGKQSSLPPLFTANSKHVLIFFPYEIRVYFISTKQCIRTIKLPDETYVDAKLDSSDPNLLWLFRETGAVIIINWKEKSSNLDASTDLNLIIEKSFDLGITVDSIIRIYNNGKSVLLLSSQSESPNDIQNVDDSTKLNGSAVTTTPTTDTTTAEITTATTTIITKDKKKQKNKKNKNVKYLISLTLDEKSNDEKNWIIHEISIVSGLKQYSLSNNLKYLIFAASAKKKKNKEDVFIIQAIELSYNESDNEGVGSTKIVRSATISDSNKQISSLAISNTGIVAIGHSNGPIEVVYSFANKLVINDNKYSRLLKWHADSVFSLQFSLEGNYLLSGGKEKVLVFWQLETEKTQFLPRLPNDIRNIIIDNNNEMYALSLGPNFEDTLILSSIELSSRLLVSSVKATFNKQLPQLQLQENNNIIVSKKNKNKNKVIDSNKYKKDIITKPKDYTTSFKIHPITKYLYFPSSSNTAQIQIFDTIKNEQCYIQTISDIIQTGKILNEEKLKDPKIKFIEFTKNGDWMATIDERESSPIDNLLSQNDIEINLKFWKYKSSNSNINNSKKKHNNISDININEWELATTVSFPHGFGKPIVSIISAPSSFYNGLAFLTADSFGGIRLWRPRLPKKIDIEDKSVRNFNETTWSIRKIIPSGSLSSLAVSLSWSEDSSFIIHGFESSLHLIDTSAFEVNNNYTIPPILGSRIRSVNILGPYIVALSKTRLVIWDILTNSLAWSARIFTPAHGCNLIAFDIKENLFALAVNYFSPSDNENKSKLMIFAPNSPLPLHIQSNEHIISAVESLGDGSFIFVDINSKIGILKDRSLLKESKDDIDEDEENIEIAALYERAKSINDIVGINARNKDDEEFDEDDEKRNILGVHSFDPVFDNSEGASLEALFENVLHVIGN